MPLTIREAEDAAIGAVTDIHTFMQEFLQDWTQPNRNLVIGQADRAVLDQWDSIPPELQDQLRQQNPEGYGRAESKIAELRNKYQRAGG